MFLPAPNLLTSSRFRLAMIGILILQLTTFSTINRADSTTLVIKGSTTIMPLARRIGGAFENLHPGLSVEVSGGGSATGIRALINGNADIATSSTFIDDKDVEYAMRQGVYPVPFQIANDCIIPIVHRSNPVTEITLADLKRIYLGQVRNWSQLGGPNRKIEAVERDVTSGTHEVWHELVMNREVSSNPLPIQDSNAGIIELISNNPDAIGYISLSYLNARVKPIRVDGTLGSSRTMRDGSYRISRPLFMFTNGWPEGKTLEYINFVLDPQRGQVMVSEAHYIPLR